LIRWADNDASIWGSPVDRIEEMLHVKIPKMLESLHNDDGRSLVEAGLRSVAHDVSVRRSG
jgi:hypothetical protein